MTAEYRCSFCGHHQEDVGRLVAGPRSVYICDRCVREMAVNFSGQIPKTVPLLEKRPRQAINTVHGPEARCSFCDKRWDDVQWVIQGPREVLICAECVWLVLQIINEAPPADPTARTKRRAGGRSWPAWLRWPSRIPHADKATRL